MSDLFDDNNDNNEVNSKEEKGVYKEVAVGEKLLQWRDYTPFVFFALLLLVNKPTVLSAVLGTLLLLVGLVIRVYSSSFVKENGDWQDLVTEGPFSYIRYPLDMGTIIIIIGAAVFSASIIFLALAIVAFALQYHFIAKYEEYVLASKLGDVYKEYKDNVPAWIPRKKFCFSEMIPPKYLPEALRREKKVFIVVAVALVLLVALARK